MKEKCRMMASRCCYDQEILVNKYEVLIMKNKSAV